MIRRIRLAFEAALLLLTILVAVSGAQVKSCQRQVVCSVYSQWYADCIPHLPLGTYNCAWNGPWSWMCNVASYKCSPTPCATCSKPHTNIASQPVDLATGNTYIEESDIRLPGLGGGLALTRTWNSQTSSYGMFGLGWTSNVEERIYVGADYLVKHLRGDGGIWSYGFSSYTADGNAVEYLLAGPSNGGATAELDWGELVGGGAGWTQFTVTYNNGERKVFDANFGILLSTADRNGNTTGFSYGGGLLLLAVTDAASRHLYFTYQQILVGQFPVNVVSSVTTDFGVSLSYQYDNLARLVKVTEPDGTFTTFAYTPANLISTVTDTNGKILESHTYDSYGRALTSSQAGGVNAVTLTYSY